MIEANLIRTSRRAKEPSNLDDPFEMYFTGTGRANKPIGMQGDIGWRRVSGLFRNAACNRQRLRGHNDMEPCP